MARVPMLTSSRLAFTTNAVLTAHHGNCDLAEKTAGNKVDLPLLRSMVWS